MKNYYQILGLDQNATLEQIKKAYRTLAKKWHPDKNPDPRARAVFIALTEAYQVLGDEDMRVLYDLKLGRQRSREAMLRQKEENYREWFDRYQEQAHRQAEDYAGSSFSDFEQSPIYRTAMVLNKVYDYIFFGIGLVMTLGPGTMWYIRESNLPDGRPWHHMIGPSVLGMVFTYGIYHFLFKNKDDE